MLKDTLRNIRRNVVVSWKTTLAGILVFLLGAGSCVLLMMNVEPGLDFYQSTFLMVLGIVVACLKDPDDNNPENRDRSGGAMAVVGLVLMSIAATSCVTQQKCAERYGELTKVEYRDSVFEKETLVYKDTLITLPGDTVTLTIENPCDSLGKLKNQIRTSRGNKSSVSVVADRVSQALFVRCECEEEKQLIQQLRREKEKFRGEKHYREITVHLKYVPWYAKWWFIPVYFIAGWIFGPLIYKLIKVIIKTIV